MKVKALTSFGGQYAMYKGAIAELPDNDITSILIAEGYIEATDEEATVEVVEEVAQDVANEETAESDDVKETESEDSKEKGLAEMTRPELLEYTEMSGIEIDKKARKDDLVKMIESALAKK